MICENCKCKSECAYYAKNIEPVLNTEQSQVVNDSYLFSLFKCLDGFICDFYEPQESNKVDCKTTKCTNCINHNYCDYEQ